MSTNHFDELLSRIGHGDDECNRLVSDEFTNIESIVKIYTYNTKRLKKQQMALNKAFGSHVMTLVFFAPVVTYR